MALQSSSSDPNSELSCTDIQATLKLWEEKHTAPLFDPIPIVTRLAELFEEKNKMYIRRDPDPFDKSHPSSTDPNCEFGRSLKLLFRKDTFTMKLVDDYLRDKIYMGHNVPKSSFDLNVAACRLILVIMPGLDITSVFKLEYDILIKRFYSWANNHKEPLRSYATGILAAAMEVEDIVNNYREQNAALIPIMLKRLHDFQSKMIEFQNTNAEASSSNSLYLKGDVHNSFNDGHSSPSAANNRPFAHLGGTKSSQELNSPTNGSSKFRITFDPSTVFPNDNSSQSCYETKFERNIIPIYPPTIETNQMLTLRYLGSIGQQLDFLGQVFEHNAMLIIFRYIENLDANSSSLTFEALKYLSSLLCHKKFSLDFISQGGLEKLLKVPRRNIAATGVSNVLYHLAFCEDAMEMILSMSPQLVSEVVKYTLCLLNCNHNSGRCHAIMFFGLTFQFKKILDEFDKQDGLRKLFNVVAVHPVSGNDRNLNELHVVVAFKNYMESHLFFKYSELSNISTSRATKQTPEMISAKVRTLQELLSIQPQWQPVERILALELISFLLQVVGYVYDWSCRYSETIRAALDVLLICCAIPKVHLMLCNSVKLQNDKSVDGINIILTAANGGNMNDCEIQKTALALLVHCVCSSTVKHIGPPATGIIANKKITNKNSEEISKKVWKSVRSNNGIFVLLQLLEIKTPITYADCIRAMAMQILAGLARSETVQQIIGKLPLFTNGQLETLIRDPILQEKRTEHVRFQKYAIELMERISGKPKSTKQIDSSLANIHKASVIAQTKIQFNEQQLFELIHAHLTERGMHETAATLQREAKLTTKVVPNNSLVHPSTFPFRYPRTPKKTKAYFNLNAPCNTLAEPQNPTQSEQNAVTTKVKLVKKINQNNTINFPTEYIQQQQRSLQKQITADCGDAISTSRLNAIEYSSNVTLETIITEYLTNQHSLCTNPMSTCPQFDLFEPHKCPDPRPKILNGVCLNFASRYHYRQAGYNSHCLDRRLVHSVMHPTRVLKTEGSLFGSCDFKPYSNEIVVGLQFGEVDVYDIETNDKYSYPCHSTPIHHVKCSEDGTLLLTSSQSRSRMWKIENKSFLMKLAFDEEKYVEFSKVDQDKILGTNGKVATIYDVRNGKKIATFTPTIENQYTRNKATFCPSDDLILTDGVLFDVRSGKELHKFDKLNQTLSGVFHPNGLEVVSNTEVWDLRTFHLLRTVPALDQSVVTFSPQNVIYGRALLTRLDTKNCNESKFSTFKTLDSYDYSSIATFDVKKNICDLSVNQFGSYIALVELYTNNDLAEDTIVRIYCVGERKNDDNGDDDNDMPDSTDSSSSSDEDESDASEWVPQRNGDVDMNNGTEEDMEEDQSSDHHNDDTDADNYSDV